MFMSNILASSSFSLGVTGTSRMLCHQLLPSWGIHECELYGVLACASQLPTEWSSRNTCWVVRSIRSIPIPISISHAPPIIRGHSLTTVVQHLRPAQRSVANFHVTWFKEKSAGIPPCYMFKKTWRRKPGVAGNPFASGMCEEKLAFYNKPRIMATCGSKGSPINLCQMMACVGQLLGVITHDGSMVLLYMVTFTYVYHQYTPNVSIYNHIDHDPGSMYGIYYIPYMDPGSWSVMWVSGQNMGAIAAISSNGARFGSLTLLFGMDLGSFQV